MTLQVDDVAASGQWHGNFDCFIMNIKVFVEKYFY